MIGREIVIVVPGRPAPKGSLKCVGRNGSHQLVEDNARTKPWRTVVGSWAGRVVDKAGKREAIGVEITSTIPRPYNQFGTGINAATLKDSAPPYPISTRTGDVDKLARLVLDALQDAGLLANDAQVVECTTRKAYPKTPVPDALDEPGVVIRVYPYYADAPEPEIEFEP